MSDNTFRSNIHQSEIPKNFNPDAHVQSFFHQESSTLTYLIYDPETRDGAIIDPVLDFDQASGVISSKSAQEILTVIQKNNIKINTILETHLHADHLTGAQFFKHYYPEATVGMGSKIKEARKNFQFHSLLFHAPLNHEPKDPYFDELYVENHEYACGSMVFEVLETPGHTATCVSYIFGKKVFVGDTLLMPDSGTGRCDSLGSDPKQLYKSIKEKIYKLSDDDELFTCHDYQPGGRQLRFSASVVEQRTNNIHLKKSTSENEFVAFRNGRDKTLKAPKLAFPSLQFNLFAGRVPTLPKSFTDKFKKSEHPFQGFFITPISFSSNDLLEIYRTNHGK